MVGSSKAYCKFGNGATKDLSENTVYSHPTSQQCSSVNVSNATGTLPVNRGGTGVTTIDALKSALGLSTGGSSQIEIYPVGSLIRFDNKIWLAVHYDDSTGRLYLVSRRIISLTQFSSGSMAYAGSTLAQVAANYQSTQMSSEALSYCVNEIVNGVTAKVFVPSYEQMNGGFDYFADNGSRIAYYNGSAQIYWTSSAYSSSYVWVVGSSGDLGYDKPTYSLGFRPAISLQM